MVLIALLAGLILSVSCSPLDPITDDIYLEGTLYIRDGDEWVPVGTGGGADYSPQHYGTDQYEALYTMPREGSALITAVFLKDTLYAHPIIISQQRTLDRIGVFTTTSGTNFLRLGIYANSEDSPNLFPGELLLDAGTITFNGVASWKGIIINITLDPGVYWLACVASDVDPGIYSVGINSMISILGQLSTQNTACTKGFCNILSYGSLPDPYPIYGAWAHPLIMPSIFVRFAS